MIRYKCPKCSRTAVLPNEMSYKFFICPGCRWQSQVFGPLASYDPSDEEYGGKANPKLSPFLPTGAPKSRMTERDSGSSQPMILGAKPPQDQAEDQPVKEDQELEEVPLMEAPAHAPAKPAGDQAAQPYHSPPADKADAPHHHQQQDQHMQKQQVHKQHAAAKPPVPPPYQQPARKYGPPVPPPPSNAGKTSRHGQDRYRPSYSSQNKPLPNGAIGAFIFALFSFVPCVGVIFGLIAMIAAGAVKKQILANPSAYSGMGLAKTAQVLGAIGFGLSWILLFVFINK